ncbi:hypothetical protein [uncultured Streptococcus sp.]|uniref:hypothetical protein n=1 Tax=uncultured Streptococcus sp. TaxID=83427 RepID=UPI0028EC4254|nr:hypothetical protein [uncultured Streptococcus sp.]
MYNRVFGNMKFDSGFEIESEICLFLKKKPICITAEAYWESDDVTLAQENAFLEFNKKKGEYVARLENLMIVKYGVEAKERFSAKQILISREGKLAILFDDSEDEDEGIAVQIIPNYRIEEQSTYL